MKYKNVKKIILISLSCIGDVLLTTPVMKALKENFPDAELTVVAGPTAISLLECHELVDRAIPYFNKGVHKGAVGGAKIVLELRENKYDLAVDLRNSMIPYVLRKRYKITAHHVHLKNRDEMKRHAIDRHLDVIEMAGIPAVTHEMSVTVPEPAETKIAALLEKKGLSDAPLIAVYPGAGSPYKLYPVEKFIQVVRMLKEDNGNNFVVVGSEADRPVGDALAAEFDSGVVSLAGEFGLVELAALLKRSRLMISNDSGPMHLGVAVGTPVVAIFGPTNADRYGPRGEKHRIVRHTEPCNPCKEPTCGQASCIEKIPPESIAEAAREIMTAVKR